MADKKLNEPSKSSKPKAVSKPKQPKKQSKQQPLVMSPLADPVISAIFSDEKSAGLAAESLIRAILEAEGEGRQFGKVIKVTPQRAHNIPGQRGCRIDIQVRSDANEYGICEIQINMDPFIMQRNLFGASHIYTKTSVIGSNIAEMAENMPVVIAVNILMYNIREDNKDILQPYKVMYAKPPVREALPQFGGYNIQLPGLLTTQPDFNSGLYCWCYTLYTAHKESKTIQEVIDMTPQLQDYYKQDSGFMQFCNQYNFAAADPRTMDEYVMWVKDLMREQGIRLGGYQDGEKAAEERWRGVVAQKDAEIADKDALIAELSEQLRYKQ